MRTVLLSSHAFGQSPGQVRSAVFVVVTVLEVEYLDLVSQALDQVPPVGGEQPAQRSHHQARHACRGGDGRGPALR